VDDLTLCVLAFLILTLALLWQEKEMHRNG
jgi:hypothetical protein